MIYDARGCEFGWEVAQVVPWMMANSKPGDIIIVDHGHKPLYKFVKGKATEGRKLRSHVPDMLGPFLRNRLKVKTKYGVPIVDGKLEDPKYGLGFEHERRWVVVHARAIDRHPERNWSKDKWDALAQQITLLRDPDLAISNRDRLTAIGAINDYPPVRVLDCRGGNLDNTIQLLKRTKLVIGASSGPMHLAQMCGAPTVVWSGNAKKDKPRYESVWNILDVPNTFVAPTWDPSVDQVMQAIRSCLTPSSSPQ